MVAALLGMGIGAGGWLLASGLRRAHPPPQRATGHLHRAVGSWAERLDGPRLGLAAAGALAGLVVTRWPVAVAAGAAAGWLVPLPGRRGLRQRNGVRTEAIAQWCEMLRDATGTARGIEGILTSTAASAPEAIRPELGRMAVLLESEPLDAVLDGLADDLAHPVGDLVVTALRVTATAGTRRTGQILGNLAAAAHHEASMARRVEVARARPRSTTRMVAVIVAAFLAGLLLFAGDYLAPYSTPVGQLVLTGIAGYWALAFWWMTAMGRIPEIDRFLATPQPNPNHPAGDWGRP